MSWRKNARTARDRRRSRPLGCETLERRALLAADFPQLIDPNPAPGNQFGHSVVPLSTGNVVVTSPFDDAGGTDAGAVYLFNGATGALISTLLGSTANDNIGRGGVKALANGNFVLLSPEWDNGMVADAGAVTWGSGVTGINDVVTADNSVVGSTAGDLSSAGVTTLTNGNYLVSSQYWDSEEATDAGAVTWANGSTGISGVVSAANSLVGSSENDQVGFGVTALTNGNYVVSSPTWGSVGAATFGNGNVGITGPVGAHNSLVGGTAGDQIGVGVVALSNGNYVVHSPMWNKSALLADAGAATFGNGASGISGPVTEINSLIGSAANDLVGTRVTPLANGNYVVCSPDWNSATAAAAGAATFGSGTAGIQGSISAANSLVGSTTNDQVGLQVTGLNNGNYVVHSPFWDNLGVDNVGAATFGSGTVGIQGSVTSANSLVGSRESNQVGIGVTALTNGNYVVHSPSWDNFAIDLGVVLSDVGAATFGDGMTGVVGTVSASNSLVGSYSFDRVSEGGVAALINGNYVVLSPSSDSTSDGFGVTDAGAATFGDGTTGIAGLLSVSNSLLGRAVADRVGSGGVTPLANGNYVVLSPLWGNGLAFGAGAATFGSGTSGVSGEVSEANSLVGSTENDRVGSGRVIALPNGNYVVNSPLWDNGALTNAGAVTFGNGRTGVKGTISSFSSAIGAGANANLQSTVSDDVNDTFFARFLNEAGGIIRVGSQIDGFNAPPVIANFGGNLVYTENGFPLPITTTATVSDVDSLNFAGGRLQVAFASGGVASDRFVIRNQGTGPGQINRQGNQVRFGELVIGTFTGGIGTTPLVVALTGSATPVRVQALLRNIVFRSTSDNPPTAPRTVRAFLTDGDGEAVGRVKRITIERENDSPELAPEAGNAVDYRRGTSPVGLLPTAIVSDPDSPNFAGGKLRVRVIEGFHDSNQLQIFGGFTLSGNNVQLDGKTIGVKNEGGGEGLTRLEITFNANATLAIVQRLTRNIRFRTLGVSPTTQRVIEFSLFDGDGGASNRVNVTVNVS